MRTSTQETQRKHVTSHSASNPKSSVDSSGLWGDSSQLQNWQIVEVFKGFRSCCIFQRQPTLLSKLAGKKLALGLSSGTNHPGLNQAFFRRNCAEERLPFNVYRETFLPRSGPMRSTSSSAIGITYRCEDKQRSHRIACRNVRHNSKFLSDLFRFIAESVASRNTIHGWLMNHL